MTCDDCRYFQARSSDEGVCKRNPPLPVLGFPMVPAADWCGEWASVQAMRFVELEPEPEPAKVVVEKPPQVDDARRVDPVEEQQKKWWQRVLG